MLDSTYFIDNQTRDLIPYKGYKIILENGELEDDELLKKSEGPFKIIADPISHGNWHSLYNLLDKDGKKLLPKGIRFITYYKAGYYLLEDNNEDELINSGEVKGGFIAAKYSSKMNVMRTDGTLLSSDWFAKVIPDLGCFRVYTHSGNQYVISLSGEELINDTGIYRLKFGCFIKLTDSQFVIYSSTIDKIAENFSSAMWSDKGLWSVHLLHKRKVHTYFNGEGTEFINYAHELLINNDVIALLERDGIWYTLDSLCNITACLKWTPNL